MKPHEAYHTDFWIDGGDLKVYVPCQEIFLKSNKYFCMNKKLVIGL
jgi:hypothetical protein